MHTEEQAKRLWCPFASVYVRYHATGAAGNRSLGSDKGSQGWSGDALCVASKCMAWRWSDRDDYYTWATQAPPGITPEEHEKIWGPAPARTGLCGLAGKP